MRTLIGLLAAVALAVPGRAGAAQWGLSAEVGVARFGGTSRDSSGVALEGPLSGRCVGSLRATGVLSGSMMNRDETPAGVERRATRRGGMSIELRYRL